MLVKLSYWDEELENPIEDTWQIGEATYSRLREQFNKYISYKKVGL